MRLAERRSVARFEIVGELWASAEALETLKVCNLAPEGALVESAIPLPVGSVQPIRMTQGAQSTELRAAVRHLSPLFAGGNERRYRIGLEFLNVDEQAALCIGSVMDEHRERTAQHGA